MTMAAILISAYLIVGLLATVIIWTALRASKQRDNQAGDVRSHKVKKPNQFAEHKTRPSRSH